MRKFIVTGLTAAALFALGGGQAVAAPADAGNCIGSAANGGTVGHAASSAAGPGFGQATAEFQGGGLVGEQASRPSCRP